LLCLQKTSVVDNTDGMGLNAI